MENGFESTSVNLSTREILKETVQEFDYPVSLDRKKAAVLEDGYSFDVIKPSWYKAERPGNSFMSVFVYHGDKPSESHVVLEVHDDEFDVDARALANHMGRRLGTDPVIEAGTDMRMWIYEQFHKIFT